MLNKTNTILVTGGAGFIGSHLNDALLKQGHKVIVIDNLVNGTLRNMEHLKSNTNFKFIEADILDADKMKEVCKDVDVVYHLACLGVRHSLHSPFENHRVNAEGTLNMLEAARYNKIKKFYYISTSEVYGEAKSFPLDENSLTYPTTVYGSSKLAGENYTMSYRHFGLDVTVLRIFNNFGPRSHYEGDAGEIIPRSIINLMYGKSPIIFGDGMITRDFFYVKDTARALASLLHYDNLSNELINIGTGVEITMKTLLEKVVELVNPTLKIEYLPSRPADVPRLWVDAAKLKQLTGFTAEYDLDSGMTETINYFKELATKEELLSKIKTINWEKK